MLMKGREGQPRPSNHTSLLKSEMIFTFLLQSSVFGPRRARVVKVPKVIILYMYKNKLIFSTVGSFALELHNPSAKLVQPGILGRELGWGGGGKID